VRRYRTRHVGPAQATSATRRHGRIGHEQIFVAKNPPLCTQAAATKSIGAYIGGS
jgi:hypothetical protein